jgi:hypothetical protein
LQPRKFVAKKVPGKWVDADQSRVLVFGSGLAHNERRKAAPHFDDEPWLKMPNHAVSNQGVHPMKWPPLSRRRLDWKVVIFVPELCKMVSQQIELHRVVHVDAHQVARLLPQGFG